MNGKTTLLNLGQRLHGIPRNFHEHGLSGGLLLYGDRLYQRWRDRRLGIATVAYLDHNALGLEQEFNEYDPVNYRCIDVALAACEPISSSDVLVDYGAGMGRVMVEAARRPFGRVLGVEISSELCAVARRNISRALSRLRCKRLDLVEGNALDWVMPPEVNHVFMFNPMVGQALDRLLARIEDSLVAAPRPLRIIYLQSWTGRNALDDKRWLRRVAEVEVPPCQYMLDKINQVHIFVYEAAVAGS